MFGPLGHSGTPQARRFRRRLGVALVALAIVALVIGELIHIVADSYSSSDRTADRSWVAAVSPLVAASNGLTPILSEIRASVDAGTSTLSAPAMRADIGALVSATSGEELALGEVRLPPPHGVGDGLSRVFAGRARTAPRS